ncbi:hypothetical protein [Aureivirga marina]|uniref:hypothetical protein n=1 Tax=Aureivirga marina TaxID=1182451 RepID=UPI0018CB1DAA|nr:hypothetical protein [Aureivirga marina]
MKFIEIEPKNSFESNNPKIEKLYPQFVKILEELNKREVPQEIVEIINKEIQKINETKDEVLALRKQIMKSQLVILNIVEKKMKLVTKNYYKNLWLTLGMTVFGLPFGVVFAFALDNMAFIAIGLPIGMAIGLGAGSQMDKKAEKEGRMLNI